MELMNKKPVEMEIYGHRIKVNIPEDFNEKYLQKIATISENKMVEVGQHISNTNMVTLALIALLNTIDENLQYKKELSKYKEVINNVDKKITLFK